MRSPEACGKIDETGGPVRVEVGGRGWIHDKGVLRAETKDADAVARLGVVSDVAAASPEALEALGEILGRMRPAGGPGIDALVVPGGLGEEAGGAARVVSVLAGAGVPVFVGLGARATRAGLAEAVAASPGAVVALADLKKVEGDDFTLVPVAGHPLARAVPPEGCRTGEAELARAAEAARGAAEPRVLVSHAPPRVAGPAGIDRAGPVAVGSPRLGAWVADAGVRFGIFGDVPESAGTASDRRGQGVAPEVWVDELFLNGGAVDPMPPAGGPGTARGTAVGAILELDAAAGTARWERIAPVAR